MREKSKCKKCGEPKRTIKNPLCQQCYLDKNFNVWSGHTSEDITEMIMGVEYWINKIEVKQNKYIDMFDINDIMNWHYEIFRSDYVCEKLPANKMWSKMYNDIKKFYHTYKDKYEPKKI